MKTKHFLFALAAPLIAAACTNDEFADNAVNLDQRETISTEGFKLGAGFDNAQTRMGFGGEAGDESLTWKLDKTGAETDRLGLCLILNNAAQTNYEYLVNTLYGATTENTYVVKNENFEPAAIRQADQEIVTESGNVRYAPQADFGTENATIFTGNYVAYYPYNTKFNEASATIPVSVASIQEAGDCTDNGYVGNYAFYISDPYQIKGGDTEANFVMRQVLPILRFEMKNTGNSALEISQIQVTAEGGMPLTATVDAALSGQVSMSNIHVGEAEEGDMQLLAFNGLNIAVDRQGKNVTYAYMTVLPGNYKNLTVKVILTDGNYMEKVIENANLTTLGTIQPIELEIDANKVEEGNPYGQVVSAADLQKALTEAGGRTSGSVEINILKNIEGSASDLFPASAMNGRASVKVRGGKITVTDAYTGSAGVDNVTFENAIEFKDTYTTNGEDDVVFAGPTTFKGAVTLTDGSSVSIAGTANVAGEVKVGTATSDAAMLNILEEGTLNAAGNVTYTSGAAHAINVEGTLNLNGNAQTGVPSVLTLNTDNVINLSGTLNINNGSATIENGMAPPM